MESHFAISDAPLRGDGITLLLKIAVYVVVHIPRPRVVAIPGINLVQVRSLSVAVSK